MQVYAKVQGVPISRRVVTHGCACTTSFRHLLALEWGTESGCLYTKLEQIVFSTNSWVQSGMIEVNEVKWDEEASRFGRRRGQRC